MTEQTFDAYLYQLVESKQKFISQIMTSKSPVRSAEDVDEVALSFAAVSYTQLMKTMLSAAIWTKPMQRLTVWIIPFWSWHREWSETVSVMLPHKTGNKIMNDKEV